MSQIAIIGCGFVADLYLRSFQQFPDLQIDLVHDHNPERLAAFCAHWKLPGVDSLQEFLNRLKPGSIVVNLTNPSAHYEINHACLSAGHHVYSEKPLALDMDHAQALYDLARDKGLLLASAPCSVLSQTAQTLAKAVRDQVAGVPRLVYAELDDGFIPQAPYHKWHSESGAPWPFEDEFRTGCTLEHAGYYLSWLVGMFGPVARVVAASAAVIPDKEIATDTPDFSVATLFFASGMVARLTCSIVAPHDHQIRVIGDKGVLSVKRAWDNAAPVRFHRRYRIRRRLIDQPLGRKLPLLGGSGKVKRRGAASMNFALGVAEMVAALRDGRDCRMSAEFALHINEVVLAIQNAHSSDGVQRMQTSCAALQPTEWAK
ncbi:MAG: oxidoreductase [Rhodobacterales bacterium]|nr:MAG: oxidoreductase [Rhodobacterales bacterium]